MKELKIGMVGLDTSHCTKFTEVLHHADYEYHIEGARIVNGYAGGSDLTKFSSERVVELTKQMRDDEGVKIFDTIEEMAIGMDAFLLTSVDGRQHLEQFKILAQYGKPVYIDKPFACSTEDAEAIVAIAKEKNIPIMSASAIRYATGIDELLEDNEAVISCESFGPMALPEDYPEYFWYGIHTVDVLFSFMGKGCKSVRTLHQDKSDIIIGEWSDGRIGVVRGYRYDGVDFGCTLFAESGVKNYALSYDPPYAPRLLSKVIEFFRTEISPIDTDEILEVIKFLDGATKSKNSNGQTIIL